MQLLHSSHQTGLMAWNLISYLKGHSIVQETILIYLNGAFSEENLSFRICISVCSINPGVELLDIFDTRMLNHVSRINTQ